VREGRCNVQTARDGSGCGRAGSCCGVSIVICAVLAAGIARRELKAEDTTPLYRQNQAAELRAPLDAVNLVTFPEPKGLRLGQFVFSPFVSVDSTYTDNPTRAEKSRVDDVLMEYAGGFATMFRPAECAKLSLNYDFGWHEYELGSATSYASHQASFNAALTRVGVEGLSLNFSEQYVQTGNSSALENQIVQFSRYQSNRAAMRSIYAYNRFKISGEYAYALQEYYERVNAPSNFRTHTGNLEFAWEWLPKRFEIFESFQLQRTLFDHVDGNDFDAYTITAGVRGVYSKFSYSFATGYAFAVPLTGPGVKGDASLNASLSYTPHRRLTFELTASRGFTPDVRTGAALATDLSAAMRVALTSRGKFSLNYTRNQSDRMSGDQQISVAYSTRFDYKITRNASAVFGFTRYERTSTQMGGAFVGNEVRLGCKLAW